MATGGGGSLTLSSEPFYDFSCSVCAKDDKHTEGESFCVECNEIYCTSCLIFHNKIAIMRHHELLDQTKMAARRPQQDLVQLPTSRCTVHPEQVINMYCGQHDLVCCTVCIAEDHRTCEGVTYIPKKAKNIKASQEFKDVNASINTTRADIEILKKYKKLDLDRITAENIQIKASIKEIRNKINNHLDDLEESARDALEKKFKIQEDQINNTLSELEDQLSNLEHTAAKLKDSHIESQLFVVMKQAKMTEKKMREFLDDFEKSVGKSDLNFLPNNEIFKTLDIKYFGTLEDQKSIASVSHHGDFKIHTLDDNNTCTISGVCQMLDGNIAITDIENEKLKLLDGSYKIIAECRLPGRPRNVCRTRTTEVAIVLAKDKIVLFAEVTDKIIPKGSFSVGEACRGIAYNKELLYVACGGKLQRNEGPGQVRVYDRTGKHLQTFMKDQHNQEMFSLLNGIIVSECRAKLHIFDEENGIVTLNLNGTEPWKFTNPDLVGPTGLCVINNDVLIVCGYDSSNLILFDKKGQKKAVLLKKEDGIKHPWSVLYDRPNSRLIVTMESSKYIKVFTLS